MDLTKNIWKKLCKKSGTMEPPHITIGTNKFVT